MLDIGTQGGGLVGFEQDLCHRLDVGGVEFLQLVDMRKDLVEIMRESADLFVGEAEIREISYVPDFLLSEFQALARLLDAM
jgi:hypothetical protein